MELTKAVDQAYTLLLTTPPCCLGDTLDKVFFGGGCLVGFFGSVWGLVVCLV